MSNKVDIQKAYDEGQKAFRKELPPDNPYGDKDQRYYAWLDGYVDEDAQESGDYN